MKNKLVSIAQCAVFIIFMTFYGFSTADGFERDTNGFSFFCLSIVIIIAWVELKKTLFHAVGK
ncbi:hypothetical protein ABW09_23345 [Pluralibacter gergoviae]|nr:hypothetical protein ABW09_23345 [Pluralibacter gergoviae]